MRISRGQVCCHPPGDPIRDPVRWYSRAGWSKIYKKYRPKLQKYREPSRQLESRGFIVTGFGPGIDCVKDGVSFDFTIAQVEVLLRTMNEARR